MLSLKHAIYIHKLTTFTFYSIDITMYIHKLITFTFCSIDITMYIHISVGTGQEPLYIKYDEQR